MMWTAAAIASQIAGIEVLRRSCKRWPFWLLGWSLFLASFFLFSKAFSASLTWGWTFAALSVIGYAMIIYRFFMARQIGIDKRKGRFEAAPLKEKIGVTLAERLISAGPLYLIAGLGVALVFATKMPLAEINRVVFGALLIPLTWAIGSLHATVDVKRWRIWAAPLLLTGLCAGLYFIL